MDASTQMPSTAAPDAAAFHIVFNAKSGSGDAAQARRQIEETLHAAGREYEFLPIDDPKRIDEVAQRAARAAVRSSGAVIVAGGDGTINAVAQAVLPTGRPFGIVPQGTFNYSSRAHGIPLEPAEATRALLSARVKPAQVGSVNGRIFLVNASLGLYPQLLQDREHYKRQYGRNRAVALWSALVTLSREHRQLLVEIDSNDRQELVRTPSIFVGNNPLQLEQVGLDEAEDVRRQRLAAVIVRPVSTLKLFSLALRGALGQLSEDRNIRNFAFRSMVVRPLGRLSSRGIEVAADGEIFWMQPPLRFSVAAQRLMLMVPGDAGGSPP